MENISGLDGLVAIGQPPELLDPEKSIDAGLRWMPTAPPQGRPRRRFIRRLLPYFRVTDKEIGQASLTVVRAAMKAGGLEHYGLPKVTSLHADNMSASEKTIAAQCADQFAEYKYILDHGMTSFANYKYYSPFWDAASRFQTMNRSVEGFSRIATLDGLPDLKALFDQIPTPFAKLPNLRQTRNAKFFRNWLEKTAGKSPDVDMVRSYLDALAERAGALDTKRGKIFKTVGMATVGMAAGSVATRLAGAEAGFAAGTVAAFVTDKCRFRFQCETGGVRELKALREMSPAAFSVSIETGSAFFRFQLGLIDHLIDRTMNPCRGASKTQMIPVGLRLSAALFSYAAC